MKRLPPLFQYRNILLLLPLVSCVGTPPLVDEDGGTPVSIPDAGDAGGPVDPPPIDPRDFDAGVGCSDTWESYGRAAFQTTCVGCHVHDHTDYADVANVRATAGAIVQRVTSDEMPMGMKLSATDKNRLLDFVACGAPSTTQVDAGVVAELNSARAAVAKVKNALTGLAPTEAEVVAVASDRAALKQLIGGWMQLPEYRIKTLQFLQLAFQQTQITVINITELVQINNNNAQSVSLLLENVKESFARTVLALEAEGRPLTDAFTTRRFMMTPALMEFYAFMDTRRHNNAGNFTDLLQMQGQNLTLVNTPVPVADSLNPSSSNYLKFYHPDVGNLTYGNTNCNATNPIVVPASALNLHMVLHAVVPPRQLGGSLGGCPARATPLNRALLVESDFNAWKMVTIRPPVGTEKTTVFFDIGALRSATELVLRTPKVGFFSTPAFHANWDTNDSNQMRVTTNQAMIVALGHQFEGIDATPSPLTPGLDTEHASQAECNACHRLLDPTRSILSATWSWNYGHQVDATNTAQKGRFIFRGVDKPVGSLLEFGSALAAHPLMPAAWVQKLCTLVNSGRCNESDPEFKRVTTAFVGSGLRWSALVRELYASPLVTNLSVSANLSAANIGVARKDQLCAMLNARLGFRDACGLTRSYGVATFGIGVVPRIAAGLPSDGYGRGAVEPVLPNAPTLFYRAALENICSDVANAVIDTPANAQNPQLKRWASTQPAVAIAEFATLLVGLTPDDARQRPVLEALQAHFTEAARTQTASNALKSTFVTACLSPTFIGVGL
jgi:hypothetical protein